MESLYCITLLGHETEWRCSCGWGSNRRGYLHRQVRQHLDQHDQEYYMVYFHVTDGCFSERMSRTDLLLAIGAADKRIGTS